MSWVALAAGPTSQLIVDASRLVAFSADDVQATGGDHGVMALLPLGLDPLDLRTVRFIDSRDLRLPAATQHDVGTAPGHIGGDGDRACAARLGNDFCLSLVLLGVQHIVGNTTLFEFRRQSLRRLDGCGTDQHGLFALDAAFDVLDDGVVFLTDGEIHQIVGVLADHRFVSRDDYDIETVDLAEFERFGIRCAGHARQLFIEPEVVLKRSGSQRLRFVLNRRAFLGFYRLMQTIGPATSVHGSSRVLIDDDDLVVLHHVVHIAAKQIVGA